MDKKKVKDKLDKIQRTLESLRGYNDRINKLVLILDDCVESAQKELSKSDWVSVEDGLPPYGEVVLVVCETYPSNIWSSSRRERFESGCTLDNHGFGTNPYFPIITHWKPIEKLEG